MRSACAYSLGVKSRVVKAVAEMINIPFYAKWNSVCESA
ncbi:hypothetical protein bmyco0001_12110 [Bacillus mycoides DSM 2048]|uniref:Uncharacterized protein n=1 Tax=Bacillus mycoides TaxID=1405 RepID=C2XR90_BACMY|nr:hypothetical protein bcere0026_12010 [Bacillus mycoides]EEM00259.1 hypothetical protein bmyco0001_12110 [Bacillus mycoides DSM 2048]